MREDEYNEFDLLVKSKLADAEEHAPRRVWKGVSASLDAASAAAAQWWRWASSALVAAALVAAGLFLGGVFDRSDSLMDDSALAVVDDSALRNAPGITSISGLDDTIPTSNHSGILQHIAVSKATIIPEAAVEDVPSVPQESTQASTATGKRSGGNGAQKQVRTEPDPFAALAWEDQRADKPTRRLALAVEGTMSGNDSDFGAYLGRVAHMANGTPSYQKTGIQEKSTSAYRIPVSVGLGLRYRITPKFSVGTGVTYSILSRNFTGLYNQVDGGVVTRTIEGDVNHEMQYIGIPLNFYFDMLESNTMKFYMYGGGAADWCISNKYRMTSESITLSEPVKGFQYSVGAGFGVEFKASDLVGVYFDPGVKYYFHSDHPKSIRTDKPFMVNFEAGLRFNF